MDGSTQSDEINCVCCRKRKGPVEVFKRHSAFSLPIVFRAFRLVFGFQFANLSPSGKTLANWQLKSVHSTLKAKSHTNTRI